EGTTIGGLPVVPGTDVLTVRGVFTTPVYYLGDGVNVGAMIAGGQINGSPIFVSEEVNKAFDFSLQPLIDKLVDATTPGLNRPLPLAVILRDVTNPDAYFVAQLDPTNTSTAIAPCPTTASPAAWGAAAAPPNCIQVGVKFRNADSDSKTRDFGNLSFGTILEETGASAFQLTMPTGGTKAQLNVPRNVHSIGILEEFRYFLRVDFEVPGDASTRFRPVLARAEFVPNTDVLVDTVDIADSIIDLQLALGFETEGLVDPAAAGVPEGYGTISDSGDNNDEILFNSPDDVLDNAPELAGLVPARWYNPAVEKHFVRITTLAESRVPNLNFWTPQVQLIEDHDLRNSVNLGGGATWNPSLERRFPRSYLRTVVEMRNLK
ncbi:MAG: hypothetical protein MI919_27815, partial [Holophagales bacterium]|nr:hypothetical protein [Holophagales bacterium]